MQSLTPLFGFPLLIGLAINRATRASVRGTPQEAHYRWQWHTGLRALGCALAAAVLIGFGRSAFALLEVLGLALLLGGIFWFMHRVVTGFIALNQGTVPGGADDSAESG